MHRLDKAAGNRKPEASTGADMVALLGAIEFVKYTLLLSRRNAVAFIDDLQGDPISIPRTPDRYRGVGRCIFGGVVQQVEKHLFEQYRVEFQHRQVGREL